MLKMLIAVVLLGILLWAVTDRLSPQLERLGVIESSDGPGEAEDAILRGSVFPVTFRSQYLCSSEGRWRMLPKAGGSDGEVLLNDEIVPVDGCEGPFQDSVALCRALGVHGEARVRLYHEGRMLECL